MGSKNVRKGHFNRTNNIITYKFPVIYLWSDEWSLINKRLFLQGIAQILAEEDILREFSDHHDSGWNVQNDITKGDFQIDMN